MKTCNIVLCGVGGQGVLLAAEMLGTAAVKKSFNVRVSEVHGMAQRGGAVVCHVRIGEKALSPTVLEGTADVIVSLEPMETLRNIRFATKNTIVLTNIQPLIITGKEYPNTEEIFKKIRGFTENLIPVDTLALSEEAGAAITQNIVMMGALAATEKLPIETETLKETIQEMVPEKYLKMNITAFELGYKSVKSSAS
jgi:indolepyruvate ferredoxin oxidoreductase beta subunit